MRTFIDVDIFTTVLTGSQEPEFDHLRKKILECSTIELPAQLRSIMGVFREDDYPNFHVWISVFNRLDSIILSIISKFRVEFFLPFVWTEIFSMVTPESVERAKTECEFTDADAALDALKTILRWTRCYTKQAFNKGVYGSLEQLLACLRAYDDDLACLALEVLNEVVILPLNHRKLLMYDCFDSFARPPLNTKRFYQSFYDIVIACTTDKLLPSARIAAIAALVNDKQESVKLDGEELRALAEADTTLPEVPYRSIVCASARTTLQYELRKLDIAETCCDGGGELLCTAILSASEAARSDCALDLSSSCSSSSSSSSSRSNTQGTVGSDEDAFVLLWRLRLQRLQLDALLTCNISALWNVRTIVYQAHHLLLTGNHEGEILVSFYKDKVGGLTEPCSMIALADAHFESAPHLSKGEAQASFLNSVQWASALLTSVTKKRFDENASDDEDEDESEYKRAPSMRLECPFDAVLAPLGLGTRQMMGLLPSVIKRSIAYLRTIPLNSSAMASPEEEEQAIQRLRHIESLLYLLLHIGELRAAVPTLVENGVIHALLDAIKPPGIEAVPSWDELMAGDQREVHSQSQSAFRNVFVTQYESLRLCIDSFVSQVLDLMMCKKFARDTFTALHGLEVYVWRLYFETSQLCDQRKYCLEQGIEAPGPHLSIKSLFLSILSMSSGSIDEMLVKWVRSEAFPLVVEDIVSCIALYSAPLFTTLVNTLDELVQTDPDVGGIVRYYHTSGILQHIWYAMKNLRENLDSDCLGAFLNFLYTLHISQECVEYIIQEDILYYVLSVCFHNPTTLLSEAQLLLESGTAFALGERLHEWSRISDAMRTYVIASLLKALEFLYTAGTQRAYGASMSGQSPWEDAALAQLYYTLLILIGALLETDENHDGRLASAEFLKQKGVSKLLQSMNVAQGTPYYFLVSYARWDTFSLENRQCEIECCYSEIVQIIGVLYHADRLAVLKELGSLIESSLSKVAQVYKARSSFLGALSDDRTSVVNCRQEGKLNILAAEEAQSLSKQEAHEASIQYIDYMKEISKCTCLIQCMHMLLCGEVYEEDYGESIKQDLVQIVGAAASGLCKYKLLVSMAAETKEATRLRVKALEEAASTTTTSETERAGRIFYKLFVVSKAKVKESPDIASKTISVINLRSTVRAVRAVELPGGEEEASLLWYELAEGGWIGQNSVYATKANRFGSQDSMQVALVSLEWDAAAAPLPLKYYNNFERLADVPSARQAGVYSANALYITAEIFLTEVIAHLHATLPLFSGIHPLPAPKIGKKSTNISTVVPNIVHSIKQMCDICSPLKFYILANGEQYKHGEEKSRNAPKIPQLCHVVQMWDFSAEHVTFYLQVCCACTGVLFGKQLEKDLAVDQKGFNILGLLNVLYEVFPDASGGKGKSVKEVGADDAWPDERNSAVLYEVLCGTALVFQACFPCPEHVTSVSRRQAWNLRRAAALSAVDEVLHFWFLLLYCSTPLLHGKGRSNKEIVELENQMRGVTQVYKSAEKEKQFIDIFQALQDTASMWAVIVLPLLSQPQLSQLPASVLAKSMTCLSQARNSFSDLADEHLHLFMVYNTRSDDFIIKDSFSEVEAAKQMAKEKEANDVVQTMYHSEKSSATYLPLSHTNLYREECLSIATPTKANILTVPEFLQSGAAQTFVKTYEKYFAGGIILPGRELCPASARFLAEKGFLDCTVDDENNILHSKHDFQAHSPLGVSKADWSAFCNQQVQPPQKEELSDERKYYRNLMTPKATPAIFCVNPTGPAADAMKLQHENLSIWAADAHYALASALKQVAKTFQENPFVSFETESPNVPTKEKACNSKENKEIIPICLILGLTAENWSNSFLNILNCCLAGLANGIAVPVWYLRTVVFENDSEQPPKLFMDQVQASSAVSDAASEAVTRWFKTHKSLHQGYRATTVILAWLSQEITNIITIGTDEATCPDDHQLALAGLLRAFFILFSCGTNSITLFKTDATIGQAHELHLDALCVLWRMHPLLTPLGDALQSLVRGTVAQTNDESEKREVPTALLDLAVQCIDTMTRTFLHSKDLDMIVLSLAAVIPDALAERGEVYPNRALSDELSARMTYADHCAAALLPASEDMCAYLGTLMTAYTTEELDAVVHAGEKPRASWSSKWTWTDEFAYRMFASQIKALFSVQKGNEEHTDKVECVHEVFIAGTSYADDDKDKALEYKCRRFGSSHGIHSGNSPAMIAFRPENSPTTVHAVTRLCLFLARREIARLSDSVSMELASVPEVSLLLSSLQLILHSITVLSTHGPALTRAAEACAAMLDPSLSFFETLFTLARGGGLYSRNVSGSSTLFSMCTSLLQVTNTVCSSLARQYSFEQDVLETLLRSVNGGVHFGEDFEKCAELLCSTWNHIFLRDPLVIARVLNSDEFAQRWQKDIAMTDKNNLTLNTVLGSTLQVKLIFDTKVPGWPEGAATREFRNAISRMNTEYSKNGGELNGITKDAQVNVAVGISKFRLQRGTPLYSDEPFALAQHLAQALAQMQRTCSLGRAFGESLLQQTQKFWQDIRELSRKAQVADPDQQAQKALLVAKFEQTDACLAHTLISYAETLLTLGLSSYAGSFFLGIEEAAESASPAADSPVYLSSCAAEIPTKSIVMLILKALVFPADSLLGGESHQELPKQMYNSSYTRKAVLYFTAAHLSLRSGKSDVTASCISRELEAISAIEDIGSRVRKTAMFINAMVGLHEITKAAVDIRRVIYWNYTYVNTVLRGHGYYKQLAVAYTRVLLGYRDVYARHDQEGLTLRGVLDECLTMLAKHIRKEWVYFEIPPPEKPMNPENEDSMDLFTSLNSVDLTDQSANPEEQFTPPKFAVTDAGAAGQVADANAHGSVTWQSPDWHLHSGLTPEAQSSLTLLGNSGVSTMEGFGCDADNLPPPLSRGSVEGDGSDALPPFPPLIPISDVSGDTGGGFYGVLPRSPPHMAVEVKPSAGDSSTSETADKEERKESTEIDYFASALDAEAEEEWESCSEVFSDEEEDMHSDGDLEHDISEGDGGSFEDYNSSDFSRSYAREDDLPFNFDGSDEGYRHHMSHRRSRDALNQNDSFEVPAISPRAARRRCLSAIMMPGSAFSDRSATPDRPAGRAQTHGGRRGGAVGAAPGYGNGGDSEDDDESDSEGSQEMDSDEEPSVPSDYVQEMDTDYGGTEEDSTEFSFDSEAVGSWPGGNAVNPNAFNYQGMFHAAEGGITSNPVLENIVFKHLSHLDVLTTAEKSLPSGHRLSARSWAVDFPVVDRIISRSTDSLYESARGFREARVASDASALASMIQYSLVRTYKRAYKAYKNNQDISVADGSIVDTLPTVTHASELSAVQKELEDHSNKYKEIVTKINNFAKASRTTLYPESAGNADQDKANKEAERVEALQTQDALGSACLLDMALRLRCSALGISYPRAKNEDIALNIYNMFEIIAHDEQQRWENVVSQMMLAAVDLTDVSGDRITKILRSYMGDVKWSWPLEGTKIWKSLSSVDGGKKEPEHIFTMLYMLIDLVNRSANRQHGPGQLFSDSTTASLFTDIITHILDQWHDYLHVPADLRRATKLLWRLIKNDTLHLELSSQERQNKLRHSLPMPDKLFTAIASLYMSPECDNDQLVWVRLRKFIAFWCGSERENDPEQKALTLDKWRRLRKLVVLPVALQLTEKLGVTMKSIAMRLQVYAETTKALIVDAIASGSKSAALVSLPACPELPPPGDEVRLTQVMRLLQLQPAGWNDLEDEDSEALAAIVELQEAATWDAMSANLEHLAAVEAATKMLRGDELPSVTSVTEATAGLSLTKPTAPAGHASLRRSNSSGGASPRRQGLQRADSAGGVQSNQDEEEEIEVEINATRVVSPALMRFSSAIEAFLNVMCGFQHQFILPTFETREEADKFNARGAVNATQLPAMTPGSIPNLGLVQPPAVFQAFPPPIHDTPSTPTDSTLAEETDLQTLAPVPLQRQFSLPGMRFRATGAFRALNRNLNDPRLSSRLSAFACKNRLLLNARLKQHPRLLEGPLVALLVLPECRRYLDFSVKRKFLTLRLERMTREEQDGDDVSLESHLSLPVSRDRIFEDSMDALESASGKSLLGTDLRVYFNGEEGVDEGGLTREWYGMLTREIFRPHYELFTPTGDGVTFQPNSQSARNPDHLRFFFFVGRVLAKALADGQLLDVHFTRTLYKHLVGQPVSFRDLKAADAGLYKNLQMLLEHKLEDLGLDLTFSAEPEEGTGGGQVELIPGGCNVAVTDENKDEYVKLLSHHKMTASVREQIDAFLDGFHDVVPPELISIFDAQELELLMAGLPDIDIDDMQQNCIYGGGYKQTDDTIQKFWSVLRRFNREEKAQFVQFVTGSAKVPLDGFSALRGAEGVQRMAIHKAYDATLLPTAHTCFNQLDLPEYESEDKLREMLLTALKHGSEGFGFA